MKEMAVVQRGLTVCTNCGQQGHHFKQCSDPVTSYGILAFRINDSKWNQTRCLATSDDDISGIPLKDLQFLMIQRRDSIGYVELIRAKYKLTDIEYIREQIAGSTDEERNCLRTKTFYELWTNLWGPMNTPENRQYKQEYEQAKTKFETLKNGYLNIDTWINLDLLIDETPVLWKTPEWGFPKGRRNVFESDYSCAIREFCEETGLLQNQLRVFENIQPIRETFLGNNNIRYSHVYYLAWLSSAVQVRLQNDNELMVREIGGIGWFSPTEAAELIRSINPEKREVLFKAINILQKVCPLLVGPVAEIMTGRELAATKAQNEGVISNRKAGE
jgi:8-oxo-dGTP pyrophosphatase MutT (NUDIX family)